MYTVNQGFLGDQYNCIDGIYGIPQVQFIAHQYWILPVHFVPNVIDKWISK